MPVLFHTGAASRFENLPTNQEALCLRGNHQHSLLEFTWATRDVTTECGGQGYQGQLNKGCNSAGAFTCTTAATVWVLVGTGSRIGLWKTARSRNKSRLLSHSREKNGIEFYNEATTAPVGLLEARVASIATGVWSTISVSACVLSRYAGNGMRREALSCTSFPPT